MSAPFRGDNIASNPDLAAVEPKRAHSLLVKRYLPAREVLRAAVENEQR